MTCHVVQANQLSIVSELSPVEIREICDAFKEGLERMLKLSIDNLKQSLRAMSQKSSFDSISASSKFEICLMNAGSIVDFHKGLTGRVGT